MSELQRRRNRQTGTVVTVWDLDLPDAPLEREWSWLDDTQKEDGDRWLTMCEDHGNNCSHSTLALARSHAAQPANWCSTCRDNEASET